MEGIVVLDKPGGISSHDAVQRLRRLLGVKRIGHLGTLDPLGTGVLPLAVGRATRLAQFFLGHERAYEAVIRCGFSTSTYDSEGEPASQPVEYRADRDRIEQALEPFRGKIDQVPPPVSAKKVDGVRAYELARRNQPVELAPAAIEIFELRLLAVEGDRFRIQMRCSAGTYVRSLAHDVGRALGVGAHVAELRRTAMGEFRIKDARTFDELDRLQQQDRIEEAFLEPARLLPELPVRRVDETTAARIAHGRDFNVSPFADRPEAPRVKAIGPNGRLLAIAEMKLPTLYHPLVVFI